MFYTIYQTTNKLNGKFYVGKHKTNNLDDGYLGSGLLLGRAINKYGPENFEKKILFFLDSEDEMNAKEKEIVNEEFVAREDTYNLKVGGEGGWDFVNDPSKSGYTHELRVLLGGMWKNNPEIYQKYLSKVLDYYENRTEEEKRIQGEKITARLKEYYKSHPGTFLGKHHTDEAKRKIGEKNSIVQLGENNSHFNHHWWKDPNDKTKFLSIKEGDPVPEGWVRGRWVSEEQIEKNRMDSAGRSWYYNPITKETKHTKLSPEEEQQLLSNGWLKGHRNPDCAYHLSIRTYTSDGKNRLKIKEGESIPEGYVLLYFWNQQHPKRKKTEEELKASQKRAIDAAAKVMHEKNQQWIKENIALWKEMYLWYLDNNEDFEALCAKYNYTKGKINFQYLIRKYLPEIYKFDTRKYSKPRPKTRGPYKKRKQLSV